MIKVVINNHVYYYDSPTDVYSDYPDAVYKCGYFIAEEKGDEEQ